MAGNKQLQEEVPPTPAKLQPVTSSPLKRNSDGEEKKGCNETNKNKRPKVVLDGPNSTAATDADTNAVDTTVATTSSSPNEGKSIAASISASATTGSSSASAKTNNEVLDLAETLGLKPGARIEVQWEIHNDTTEETEDENDGKKITTAATENTATSGDDAASPSPNETATTVSIHWWKAELLEYDGRTTDSVAVRSLLYEARPDLGFPEPSREDVVFLGKDVLVASTDVDSGDWENNPDAVRQMPYRRVNGEEVFYYNDDQLDEQLNDLLMGAFQKNQRAWKAMPAAQQAIIAEKIQQKKEQLKQVLQAEAKHKVITSETIKDILARTF
uniref:Uncharacterized protein n=1 Tax=Pseudo-nitzschia australis TaxID=44445 RepID=A0A7S4AH32_9STRA|mmetsp:Transcript_9736/g.21024  ORF Transcript_9736/g.21024 Transcript_9736/m.21024 type:complete len:330 (-) Transcript_9736:415-1404(-)|eukprot:CAMPEP_0168171442 /NCGR_PEP_ID=MMETSP0139_2-20121125/4707_1 /TAXON_ID=44445 /ORGANISM="Pseudo-nitzschia australis, Strain 10249 10 AB" /LENGTH=329 /DNA_ID=CAMNT_0008088995 /DNA_START=135 /DNA_END=1124 /DNA_ORIENTATION=+